MRLAISLTFFAAIAACAPSPSRIAAVDPEPGFANVPCGQVLAKLREEELALSKLVAAQEKAMQTDAASVAIIGLPLGSLAGKNQKDEIAQAKGRVQALRDRQDACG